MPKRVDHGERRRELIEALWWLAQAHGLEGVSLGQVAVEAGVSKGLVQHYFRSKDEMLLSATTRLREHVEARITAAGPGLRAMLVAMLPTDEGSRREAMVGRAFLFRAHHDPLMAERVRAGDSLLRSGVAEQVRADQAAGELRADLDPPVEADLLLAVVGGLGEALVQGHHTPDAAVALLDHQLDRLRG